MKRKERKKEREEGSEVELRLRQEEGGFVWTGDYGAAIAGRDYALVHLSRMESDSIQNIQPRLIID